jgi:hypothetical protein
LVKEESSLHNKLGMLLHRLSDEVFKCNPELLEYLPSIDSVDIDLPLLTIFNTYSE